MKDRGNFAAFMKRAGIQVDKHNDRNDKYRIFGGEKATLKETARVDKDIIHIPIHASLGTDEVEFVVKKIKEWDRR